MILTNCGEHIAAGCNEVPMAGGGHFWDGQQDIANDDRDFRLGADQNTLMKYEMIGEVFDKIKELKWLRPAQARKKGSELAAEVFDPKLKQPFKDLRVANIIEFGRIVHAEMSAITDAARRGIAIKDAILVCTTFPCHMCARHIIASGIKRVVYIEPYPKSMAPELYDRSIWVDDDEPKETAVHFAPFIGLAPLRFMELFSFRERKDKLGYVVNWPQNKDLIPVSYELVNRYNELEVLNCALVGYLLASDSTGSKKVASRRETKNARKGTKAGARR